MRALFADRRAASLSVLTALALALALPGLAETTADPVERARAAIAADRFEDARPILEPQSDDEELSPERLLLLTRVLSTLHDYEAAERYGKLAVERMPDSSEAHYRYAEALRVRMDKGNRMRAMLVVGPYKSALRRALELDPANILARVEQIGFMINAPSIVGGGTDRARERIEQLEKIDSGWALVMQGLLELNAAEHLEAVNLLDRLFRDYPDATACHTALATWYRSNQRFPETERHLAALSASAGR